MTSHPNHQQQPTPLPESAVPLALPEKLAEPELRLVESPVRVEPLPIESPALESTVVPEARPRRVMRRAAKVAGGLALTTYLLFGGGGGEQQADAEASVGSSVPATTAEASASESGGWNIDPSRDIPIGLGIATALAGVVAYRKQTKEKIEDRFNTAERDLGEKINENTTGEQRGTYLRILDSFSDQPKYKTRVFGAALEYLRGRRGGLEALRAKHLGPPTPEHAGSEDPSAQHALSQAITERRYADNSALKILLKTLPDARKAAKAEARRKITRSKQDKFADLAAKTNAEQEPSRYQVKVRGIELSDLRGIDRADFSKLDMAGAGLRHDNFTLVDFSGSSLREAHLRGSVIAHSDLQGTDLRAANLHGAVIRDSMIDGNTKMGVLPDTDPKAKLGGLDRENMDKKRGNGEVVLSNLKAEDGTDVVALVKDWQRNGLKLLPGSNHEYFLDPNDDPNWPSKPSNVTPKQNNITSNFY